MLPERTRADCAAVQWNQHPERAQPAMPEAGRPAQRMHPPAPCRTPLELQPDQGAETEGIRIQNAPALGSRITASKKISTTGLHQLQAHQSSR